MNGGRAVRSRRRSATCALVHDVQEAGRCTFNHLRLRGQRPNFWAANKGAAMTVDQYDERTRAVVHTGGRLAWASRCRSNGPQPVRDAGLAFEYHYFFTRKFWMAYFMQAPPAAATYAAATCRRTPPTALLPHHSRSVRAQRPTGMPHTGDAAHQALVVAPGGSGTCDELFEIAALKQTGKMEKKRRSCSSARSTGRTSSTGTRSRATARSPRTTSSSSSSPTRSTRPSTT